MQPHWINYITDYSSPIQLVLFVVLLFICWNIENIAGITLYYNKWKHAFLNAGFIFTNLPVQLLLGLVFVKTIHWTVLHHFGLLNHLPLAHHLLLLFISSFIFLDLGEYIYHVIMHRVKRLWMFHLVHHSDTVVDVSTTLREHPGENFIRLTYELSAAPKIRCSDRLCFYYPKPAPCTSPLQTTLYGLQLWRCVQYMGPVVWYLQNITERRTCLRSRYLYG